MTDGQFEAFINSLDDACRKAPSGERAAVSAKCDAFNAELQAIQTSQRAIDRGRDKVEALCRKYGWIG